ncbi:5,10-methylenetetrahydrofolate reductase [Polystyrenella longa]|uniref:Methylenetetrahydrofolate reductase n=1 Tax=Polystyrenella longa TaxID=2528007 RepID=A0A518CI72_9PLAN|nr:methylenetetrahydrofolate reductase [NAD(P)H] [Polystyrenella longa]QDU78925.1 5,10-methylenetetrahydrofolate reductase [Polystyrenella longa]
MRLADIFRDHSQQRFSIEIFPPQTEKGEESLLNALTRLTEFGPGFVSCTYGAGGSTQQKTLEWCEKIQNVLQQTATAHFTCVGSSREELVDWLNQAAGRGVQNIMALRGDPPRGETEFKAAEGGLRYANELVELIREHSPNAGIGVAGYPEKHLEAPSMADDLDNLKRKVDAGADVIVTQMFYNNEHFFRFQEACQARQISIPVVPGIMPITNFQRIQRITAMCGSEIPEGLASRLEAVQDDEAAQFEIGVEFAIQQCRELLEAGVPGIHFYVLNKSQACEQILEELNFQTAT